MITLTLTGQTLDELQLGPVATPVYEAMARKLRAAGYCVELARDYETPKALAKRLGISQSHVSQQLKVHSTPTPAYIRRGPTGRVLILQSTPALDAWLTQFKK